jgi:two-component system, LytTR family, response regulator LytT
MASLSSVKEAIAYLKENVKPDLIFSDIQLGDGLSFEIFKAVNISVPVIFCTAYDEYALNAFKTNSIDYILKPFTTKTIEAALNKYHNLKQSLAGNPVSYEAVLKALMKEASPQTTHILIHYKEKILPVSLEDIAVFYIENEVTRLMTFDKKSYSADKNLEDLEQIAGNAFFRVNRQCMVNRRAVVDASRYFSRKLSVNLNVPFKETITVSKEKTPLFLNWLEGGS